MGSLTVNRQDLFPPGTTVSAYANQGHGVPVSGPPFGVASASGVVPDSGELTFTGLTPAAEYILYASSPDRYLRMLVPGQPGGAAEDGGGGSSTDVIVEGAVTDATFQDAAGRAAADGDRAVDSVNLRSYVRVSGQWSFSPLTLTLERIVEQSPLGNEVVWEFAEPTIAGQYASGRWWVQAGSAGTVPITAVTPDYDPGAGSGLQRNGMMVNPDVSVFSAPQSLDGRAAFFQEPTVSLPYDARPGDAILKIISTSDDPSVPNHTVQTQFISVLTVVSTPPGLHVLAPPFVGTRKDTIDASNLRTDLLPALASTPHKITTQQAIERTSYTRGQVWPSSTAGDSLASYEAHGDSVADGVTGLPSYGNTWGGNMFRIDTELMAWLCSDGATNAEKAQVALGYAQTGIDIWGAVRYGYGGGAGLFRGGGGNGAGMLLPIVFAAVILDNQDIKDWLADGDWTSPAVVDAKDLFWETRSFYRAAGGLSTGLALWGQPVQFAAPFTDDQSYWADLNNPDGSGIFNGTTRDPYQLVDGGSPLGESYQDNTSHQVMVLSAIFDVFPELQAAWPTVEDNAAVLYEYGARWGKRGAHALPDDAAPKTDTVHATDPSQLVHYGTDYGLTDPDDPDSYVRDPGFDIDDPDTWTAAGRWPDRHGFNTAGGNRSTLAAHEFWAAYHAPTFPPDGLTLLDDFTGTTADPPNPAIWSGPRAGEGALVIVSNQLGAADGSYRSAVSVDTFGPDLAATFDMKTVNAGRQLFFFARLIDGDSYVALGWDAFAEGGAAWKIFTFRSGGFGQTFTATGTIADGDGFGVWLVGTDARIYHRLGLAGGWTKVLEATVDVNQAGNIAIQMNANEWRVDNLQAVTA